MDNFFSPGGGPGGVMPTPDHEKMKKCDAKLVPEVSGGRVQYFGNLGCQYSNELLWNPMKHVAT
jgi:hypothetical protein